MGDMDELRDGEVLRESFQEQNLPTLPDLWANIAAQLDEKQPQTQQPTPPYPGVEAAPFSRVMSNHFMRYYYPKAQGSAYNEELEQVWQRVEAALPPTRSRIWLRRLALPMLLLLLLLRDCAPVHKIEKTVADFSIAENLEAAKPSLVPSLLRMEGRRDARKKLIISSLDLPVAQRASSGQPTKVARRGTDAVVKIVPQAAATALQFDELIASTELSPASTNSTPLAELQIEGSGISLAEATKPSLSAVDSSLLPSNSFSLPENSKEIANTKRSKTPPALEIGMGAELSTHALLGEKTFAAIRKDDWTKTEFRGAVQTHLMLRLQLHPRHAVGIYLYPNNRLRQDFGGFTSEGKYEARRIEMRYGQARAAYNFQLRADEGISPQFSSFWIGGEVSSSRLWRVCEHVDEQLNTNLSYRKWAHTAGVSLGYRHRFGRVAFQYGLNATASLSDVLRSTELGAPSGKLLSLSAFCTLAYRLQ